MSACGPLDGSTSEPETGDPKPAATTDLAIEVWPQGRDRPARSWSLRCDPVGGTLPGARRACARLRPEALRPLDPGSICTQVYGGPQTARVHGRVRGRPVDTRFSRTNGCEIHRWDNVRFLFPVRI